MICHNSCDYQESDLCDYQESDLCDSQESDLCDSQESDLCDSQGSDLYNFPCLRERIGVMIYCNDHDLLTIMIITETVKSYNSNHNLYHLCHVTCHMIYLHPIMVSHQYSLSLSLSLFYSLLSLLYPCNLWTTQLLFVHPVFLFLVHIQLLPKMLKQLLHFVVPIQQSNQ